MQSIYKQSRSDSDWLQSTSDSVKVKGLHSSMFSFINTDRLPACWLQHAGNMNTSSLCIKEVNSAGWQVVVSCLYTYRNSVSWAPRTFNSYIYLTDWLKQIPGSMVLPFLHDIFCMQCRQEFCRLKKKLFQRSVPSTKLVVMLSNLGKFTTTNIKEITVIKNGIFKRNSRRIENVPQQQETETSYSCGS